MIIKDQNDVTTAVLAELERAPDKRFREILAAAVRHLHAFVREARLTEQEFQQICGLVAQAGQRTNASHNEVVLACGSLGVSQLVCLLNNGNRGRTETTANLLGPFWRLDSPRTPNGGSIVRSPTPGAVRRGPGQGHRWQTRRRCRGRHLAIVAGRALREPGSGPGRDEPARQVHDRPRGSHRLPKRHAGGIPDPDRRASGRAGARARPAQHAGRTCIS
jgi:hypothetical protein